MNLFKNFFQFAIVAFTLSMFTTAPAQAQTGSGGFDIQMHVEPLAAAYIKFDGIDGECHVNEGRNVVGENTRNGDKLILIVKNGQLVGFGVQPKTGSFKALTPNASPCFSIRCPNYAPPKCFTLPGGACVCVCGPWITTNTGRN